MTIIPLLAFLPFIAFFVLIAAGLYLQELTLARALIFFAAWVAGLVLFRSLGFPRAAYVGVEALLDCILVLMVFRGDLRI